MGFVCGGTSQHGGDLATDDVDLLVEIFNREYRLKVEAPFEGTGHLVDTAVAGVGGANDVESAPSQNDTRIAQFGDDHHLVAHAGEERILDFMGGTGDLLKAD